MEGLGKRTTWDSLDTQLRDIATGQESKNFTEDEIATLKKDGRAIWLLDRYREQFKISEDKIRQDLQARSSNDVNLFDLAASAPTVEHGELEANVNTASCHHDGMVAAAVLGVSLVLIPEGNLLGPTVNEFEESLFWTKQKYRTYKEDFEIAASSNKSPGSKERDHNMEVLVKDVYRVYGTSSQLTKSVLSHLSGGHATESLSAYNRAFSVEFEKTKAIAIKAMDLQELDGGVEDRPPPLDLTEKYFRLTYQGRSSILAGVKAVVDFGIERGWIAPEDLSRRGHSEADWMEKLGVLKEETKRECSYVEEPDDDSFRTDVTHLLGLELQLGNL